MRKIRNILHILKGKIQRMVYKVKNYFIAVNKITKLENELKEQDRLMARTREELTCQELKTQELEKHIESLERGMEILHERLYEIESFMASAKGMVKETQGRTEIEKKKKWLGGYPDETKKEV